MNLCFVEGLCFRVIFEGDEGRINRSELMAPTIYRLLELFPRIKGGQKTNTPGKNHEPRGDHCWSCAAGRGCLPRIARALRVKRHNNRNIQQPEQLVTIAPWYKTAERETSLPNSK